MIKRTLLYLAKFAAEGTAWDVLVINYIWPKLMAAFTGAFGLAGWAKMDRLHPSQVATVFICSLAGLLVIISFGLYLTGRVAAWLATKNQSIDSRDVRDRVVLVYTPSFQVPPEYAPIWNNAPEFTLWQAAWLFAGREPVPKIPPGTAAYPYYRMLKSDYENGLLPARQNDQSQGIGYFSVRRPDLVAFANRNKIEPKFLFF